jgi:hypothetical protein
LGKMTPIRQELATAIRHRDAAKAELDRFDEQLASMRWRKSEAQARLDAIKADRVVLVDKYMDDAVSVCRPASMAIIRVSSGRGRRSIFSTGRLSGSWISVTRLCGSMSWRKPNAANCAI